MAPPATTNGRAQEGLATRPEGIGLTTPFPKLCLPARQDGDSYELSAGAACGLPTAQSRSAPASHALAKPAACENSFCTSRHSKQEGSSAVMLGVFADSAPCGNGPVGLSSVVQQAGQRPDLTARKCSIFENFLHLGEFAFARDALMRFIGALNSILVLAISWKVFDHYVDTTWYIPANCRLKGHNISDFEFVGAHFSFPPLVTQRQLFDFERISSRMSQNSLGPLRSRRFRCWRSSSEAD